ncbi:MAG TPA: hypothetical protein VFF03_17960 [Rhodocyclaceae bacterium]|nr:hypothetical protein [Rhodocyclaceae bacterium]
MIPAGDLNAVPEVLLWLAWAVFCLGGFICLVNFRIFLGWVVHRLRKDPPESYRTPSAIPILGSLLVVLMLRTLGSIPVAKAIGIGLIVIDMGGIHWLLLGIPYAVFKSMGKRRRERRAGAGSGEGGDGYPP